MRSSRRPQADREIAAGHYRGALHGIPWGAKDLIAYPGYPTTWGATPYKGRVIEGKATVAARLEEAGAVMLGKLSLGALAQGDLWFGGRTRSPWDPRTGSSGSLGRIGVSRGRRAWSALRSAARRSAASSRHAAPAGRPDCGPPSAASAATAA